MKIVTGHKNESHITANDMQALYKGTIGKRDYILDIGNHFEAEITSATTVAIKDGEGVMQGVHFRIEPGEIDTITLDPGTAGQTRYDLIVTRYTKNASTGVESVNLAVVKGTNGGGIPAYTQGDIVGGDLVADAPLMTIRFDGITPAFESMRIPRILTSIADLYNEVRREDLLYESQAVESGTRVLTIQNGAEYDYFDVVYTSMSSFDASATHGTVVRHVRGRTQAMMMSVGTSAVIVKRDVEIEDVESTNTQFTFHQADCFRFYDGEGSISTSPGALIPIRIYGGRW